MELLYLWINQTKEGCIIQQEFNFSPNYKIHVNDKNNPTELTYEETGVINIFTQEDNNVI